jgi:hypothetical protein
MNIHKKPFQIGLLVRGKRDENHKPGIRKQHADCILSTGEPIGYFFQGGFTLSSSAVPTGLLGADLASKEGTVMGYDLMRRCLPPLVVANSARGAGLPSTLLLIDASEGEAKLFDLYWKNERQKPGSFYLIGRNCSTYAAEAFRQAGIISSSIPRMDTPDNLYWHLRTHSTRKTYSYFGYFGLKESFQKMDYEILPL